MHSYHALVLGATGATGKDLLDILLKDDACKQVNVFVRRPPGVYHEKLRVHVIDFDKYSEWKDLVKGDVLFSCLGTTLKVAGSKAEQWKIDHDYQLEFAKAARENAVDSYVLVSSGGASSSSPIFYAKMKGKLEEAVKALSFPRLFIFNPPLLVRKNTDRKGEMVGFKVIRFLNNIGLFRPQKPMPTEVLAEAMVNAWKTNNDSLSTYKGEAIWRVAERTSFYYNG